MMRALRLLVALIAALLLGVAGASAVIGNSGQESAGSPDALIPDGTGAALVTSASDPAGHQPWAIRVYRSKTGMTCPEAGRTQDGDFGQVDSDGVFRPNGIEAAGSCIDLNKAPMSVVVNHYPANGDRGARAVLFGVVSPSVASATLTVGGKPRDLSLARGAFMSVLSEADLVGASVDATLQDGSTKSYPLQPNQFPAHESTPDPAAP